jgi:molybdenum cofactor cytidylyltransferase
MNTKTLRDTQQALPIACTIMASGLGNRFGENKLLYKIQDKPLLQYILDTTAKFPFTERIVVTRHQEIVELCESQNIKTIFHEEPYQSDTVRIALENLAEFTGYLFCTGDQPFISESTLQKLCEAFLEAPNFIHRTIFENTPGNPVIFPAKFKGELLNLPQDCGGAYLAKKYPEQVRYIPVQDSLELYDIDTKEDLEKLFLRQNNV